jgi:uncharacterized membrane protein
MAVETLVLAWLVSPDTVTEYDCGEVAVAVTLTVAVTGG